MEGSLISWRVVSFHGGWSHFMEGSLISWSTVSFHGGQSHLMEGSLISWRVVSWFSTTFLTKTLWKSWLLTKSTLVNKPQNAWCEIVTLFDSCIPCIPGADPEYCNISKRCSWDIYLQKDIGLLISADNSIG